MQWSRMSRKTVLPNDAFFKLYNVIVKVKLACSRKRGTQHRRYHKPRLGRFSLRRETCLLFLMKREK